MSIKCWRRLAGCIAISCVLRAAAPDYHIGTAETDRVRAVVLEDRQGNVAIVADARFTIAFSTADLIAAQLLRAYPLNRAGILLHSTEAGAPAPNAAITAIAAALGDLRPAKVSFDGSRISVTSTEGECRAAFFPLAFTGCSGGEAVRGAIRSAFQVVEPEHGLEHRGEAPPAYPIQVIAFGRQPAILALGGDAPTAPFTARGVIVVNHCNDAVPFPAGLPVTAAIKQLLARVGR
jgi:hypothetical protein